MLYLISDLHGEYEKFITMLEKINFSNNDTLTILGDVVDRGNEPIKILQYIIKKPNIELILGNHEEMMLKSLIDKDAGYYNCWMSNGGYVTLKQFDCLAILDKVEILNYLQHCKLYKIMDKYILVHAGIDNFSFEGTVEEFMQKQDRETILWARDEFIFNPSLYDKTIIFGHTPTKYMGIHSPLTIWHGKGKIGIDCGAVFNGGQLGCLRLDDIQEFYV